MNAAQARETALIAHLENIARRKEANKFYQILQEQISLAAKKGQLLYEMSTVQPYDFAEDTRQQLQEAVKFLTEEGFAVTTKGDKLQVSWANQKQPLHEKGL